MSSASYRGTGADLLSSQGISAGEAVSIRTIDEETITGTIMPRYESASDNYIVIKLKSGYNTGIEVSKIKSINKLPSSITPSTATSATPNSSVNATNSDQIEKKKDAGHEKSQQQQTDLVSQKENLPRLILISTGGTIASKIDYRTGGVKAALSASDLYSSVPELATIASIDPEVLMSEYSENMKPEHWTLIANKIAEKISSEKGYDGIIVSHGTDTMHYTASALSFALQDLPIPVVLVGAQRSSDRPSSDAALNLIGAATFAARAPLAGVFVAMHEDTSDYRVAIHIGTRVRKNHTSRRDAFESIDVNPVAYVKDGTIEIQQSNKNSNMTILPRDNSRKFVAKTNFDRNVLLVKYYPGLDPSVVDHAISTGYKAIILEGTGLGHVSKDWFSSLRNAISNRNVMVCMTSQCIWGRVSMTVYDTGRDLIDIGVVPLSDMLSECALTKAMWVFANSDNPRETMEKNIANEITQMIPIQ